MLTTIPYLRDASQNLVTNVSVSNLGSIIGVAKVHCSRSHVLLVAHHPELIQDRVDPSGTQCYTMIT